MSQLESLNIVILLLFDSLGQKIIGDYVLNFLSMRTTRSVAIRIQVVSHVSGFVLCVFGFVSEPALAGGLIMLANGYLFRLLTWQGDKYGIWYDGQEA